MKQLLLSFLTLTILLSLSSCYKEKFDTSGDVQLRFSRDTMVFDTVFTTEGSATRILKIYNDAALPIKINKISLEENNGVHFRFNFDGISGTEISDLEIPGKDSIYIFGEVTIDPNAPLSSSPFVVEGQLKFETNGNTQIVPLEAWGQNANYITERNNYGGQYYYSCELGDWNWDDPEGKPYVITGILFVDSCTINIPAGTQIYVHGGVINNTDGSYNDGLLFLLSKAKIITNGTADAPVVFQTDRLEYAFDEAGGQWSGIRLGAGSRNSILNHTVVKNSIIGVRVDSAAQVTINNSQFYNISSSGVVGIHAQINLNNSLIYNTGNYGFQGIYGGTYNLNYTTISAEGNQTGAINLSNVICYDQLCSEYDVNRLNTNITNSILYGNQKDALSWLNFTDNPTDFNYLVKNTIIKETELTDDPNFADFYSNCSNCINIEPSFALFADASNGDLHLDTLSIAEGKALPITSVLFDASVDLEDNARDGSLPDIGCYEYQY